MAVKIKAKDANETARMMIERVDMVEREIAELENERHPDVIELRKRLEVEASVLKDIYQSMTGDHLMMKHRLA